jgi:DNA-binding MarR family transcriptional regulator
MQDAGWIIREPGHKDRRKVSTYISQEGAQMLTRLAHPLAQFLQVPFKEIAGKDLKQLLIQLGKIRRNIS